MDPTTTYVAQDLGIARDSRRLDLICYLRVEF